MTAKVFVDSNVLIYARDLAQPAKSAAAVDWLSAIAAHEAGVLSSQVISESLHSFIRTKRASAEELRRFVWEMQPWCTAPILPEVLVLAINIHERWKFDWWDSLIVAAATGAGCRYLLTEDLQNGQRLNEMTVISPFMNAPASIFAND